MPDTSRLVIGVAGRIGSGKTEVARYLEQECGFQYLRYSLVLAEWCKTHPDAKAQLQQVGWNVMSGEGQRELNRRLIGQIQHGRDCVVDGLRHPIDFESLKNGFASRFFLIYIDTPAEIRFQRLRERYKSYADFVAADSHPVESNIELIVSLASAVLPGTLPMQEIDAEMHGLVESFRTAEAL
jgi:dephospho-CoA kinase